ncbi:MAG TPA: DinB family protein [Burkholderiaceae bacterium]|nr:DinB family protein [Burkholderiaceae bacterium]
MDLTSYLRIQARANRLSNHRLHAAMAPLSSAEFHAPRVSFFPSLAQTLNHILEVDLYYIGALHREADHRATALAFVPSDTLAALSQRQAASDERLIGFCDALDAGTLDAVIDMERADHVQRDRIGHVLAHLFNHQTHHRGQAHAMLSGSSIKPPQIDEFMMPSESHLRASDMAALGWHEADVYR